MINVTKPFFPPIEEFTAYTQEIWKRGWITNDGPLVNELESKLREYLGVKHLLFLGNGTIALQIAIKALGLKGEIITTPFSYVATTAAVVWENCRPVFVDIDPETLNINPAEIERAITSDTSAILATHVFGNPCEIESIQKIADKYKLKVIYDAAHCFGSKYIGKSVYSFGDISTASFHATKLFHTVEGGAVITESPELHRRMMLMRNFGHWGPGNFEELGINGKNSELHAAMGIVNLKYVREILEGRASLVAYYKERLRAFKYKTLSIRKDTTYNHAYFPIILDSELQLHSAIELLNKHDIYPRRYFFPSLNKLPYVNSKSMPISESISNRILCLPLYHELTQGQIDSVCDILLGVQNN